jgi:hypothetical protein
MGPWLQVRKVGRRAAAFRASMAAEGSLHDQLDAKRVELEAAILKKVRLGRLRVQRQLRVRLP